LPIGARSSVAGPPGSPRQWRDSFGCASIKERSALVISEADLDQPPPAGSNTNLLYRGGDDLLGESFRIYEVVAR
jgi:hypothetical protein